MRLILTFTCLLTIFTACTKPSESFTQINVQRDPSITATPVKTSTGTFVDVSVDMVLSLNGKSPFEERSTSFSIGACIRSESMLKEDGHCVPDEPYTSPDSLQLAPESLQSKDFTLTLKRGETRTVTHTFRFTSTDPAILYLTGIAKGEKSDQGSIGFGGSIDPEYIVVTFQ